MVVSMVARLFILALSGKMIMCIFHESDGSVVGEENMCIKCVTKPSTIHTIESFGCFSTDFDDIQNKKMFIYINLFNKTNSKLKSLSITFDNEAIESEVLVKEVNRKTKNGKVLYEYEIEITKEHVQKFDSNDHVQTEVFIILNDDTISHSGFTKSLYSSFPVIADAYTRVISETTTSLIWLCIPKDSKIVGIFSNPNEGANFNKNLIDKSYIGMDSAKEKTMDSVFEMKTVPLNLSESHFIVIKDKEEDIFYMVS
jgi:hypothetical protein